MMSAARARSGLLTCPVRVWCQGRSPASSTCALQLHSPAERLLLGDIRCFFKLDCRIGRCTHAAPLDRHGERSHLLAHCWGCSGERWTCHMFIFLVCSQPSCIAAEQGNVPAGPALMWSRRGALWGYSCSDGPLYRIGCGSPQVMSQEGDPQGSCHGDLLWKSSPGSFHMGTSGCNTS